MSAPQRLPDKAGHYGIFGGQYVPEALHKALSELDAAFDEAMAEEGPNIPWAQAKADLGWV